MLSERHRFRIFYSLILVTSITTMRCSAHKPGAAPSEPVTEQKAASTVDSNLPPELQNVDEFDPAATIDAEAVKGSDFYEVKKTVENNKSALENEWKSQDEQEEAVKKAKEAERLKREQEQAAEEKAREQARLNAVKDHKTSEALRKKYMREANARVKKMPTITKQELLWNGLED